VDEIPLVTRGGLAQAAALEGRVARGAVHGDEPGGSAWIHKDA
jgi:hypothetical protein